jgi:K+-transporting ATPase KdpF subunit
MDALYWLVGLLALLLLVYLFAALLKPEKFG